MTDTSNKDVVGWIQFYDRDRQFGFASVDGQRVFFHQSACREVEGTPEDPILTDRPYDRRPQWSKRSARVEHVVLRVVSGQKGSKATVWSFRPKRTWLEDLAHFGRLTGYNGGKLSISYTQSWNGYGRVHRKVEGRLTVEPQLMPGSPWQLSLQYDVYNGLGGIYGKPTGRVSTTFPLDEAHPSKFLPYGRYAMDVYIASADEWAHIMFFPTEEQRD